MRGGARVARHASPERQVSARFQPFMSLLPEKLLHNGKQYGLLISGRGRRRELISGGCHIARFSGPECEIGARGQGRRVELANTGEPSGSSRACLSD